MGAPETSVAFLLEGSVEIHDKITDILSDKGLVHLLEIDLLLYSSDQLSLEENKQVLVMCSTLLRKVIDLPIKIKI